ncbi:MAG: hypothetical protein Q7S48_00425 [bacterium]|nr:hypothetical protein [bacterium]
MSHLPSLLRGITCVALSAFLFAPILLHAAPFTPNSLISDTEFIDVSALDTSGVQRFLSRYQGVLGRTQFIDIDGAARFAAEIISRAAVAAQISPQVILATLQKEQSLIENPNPSGYNLDWAMGYGICDSCSSSDPGLEQYRGFAAQIHFSAARLREYIDRPGAFGWIRNGTPLLIDNTIVIPENDATRALYLYTPHISGNQKFVALWARYFKKQYPDGTVVQQSDTENLWRIDNGKRRKFETYSVFLSQNRPSDLISISESDLLRYEIGTPIRFAQYSLIRSPAGTVYLIVGNAKRGFSSREAMRKLGFTPFEVEDVGFDALDDYQEGEPITATSNHPVHELLQDRTSGGVFFVQDGFKFPIRAREIMKTNFPLEKPRPVRPAELALYPTGSPIGFKEGALISAQGNAAVFLISDGVRRPFSSAEAFTGLGFKWENVVKVPAPLLSLHALGAPLDVVSDNLASAGL